MANKVNWTCPPGYIGETWNVVRGCAEPCGVDCWAARQAIRSEYRKVGDRKIPGPYFGLVRHSPQGPVWTRQQALAHWVLGKPIHWKKKRRCVAVSLMGDLFGSGITDEQIASVYGVMAVSGLHRFIIPTKQSERRLRWYHWARDYAPDDGATGPTRAIWDGLCESDGSFPEAWDSEEGPPIPARWPLGNVLEVASAHDQRSLEKQANALAQTVAFRGLSLEPLQSAVDVEPWIAGLEWVIVGADSNQYRAEALPLKAVESVVDQCTRAGVAVFVKGLHLPNGSRGGFYYTADPVGWPTVFVRREWPRRLFGDVEEILT